MLFRAVFWVGLVSILLPREPEPAVAQAGAASSRGESLVHTAAALDVISTLQTALLRQLTQIKADIEVQRRDRGEQSGSSTI